MLSKGKKTVIITAFLLILVAAGIAGVFYLKREKNYNATEQISKEARKEAGDIRYLYAEDGTAKYSRDGITRYNAEGSLKWTASYTMLNPVAVCTGDYSAVADFGGTEVIVYDSKGTANELNMISKVMQIALSEQGEVAVLMEESESYRIQIYDPYSSGDKKKAEIFTYTKDDGYALAMALSKDGGKLVTSYVDVTGKGIKSKLTFYNFSGVGQGANADRIVGVFPYEDEIFTRLVFMDNDTVCAVGDSRVAAFSMKQKPETAWEHKFESTVKQLEVIDDTLLILTEEENFTEKLTMIGKNGKKGFEKKLDFDPSAIGAGKREVWAYKDKQCLILDKGGRVSYCGELDENILFLADGRERNTFYFVGSNSVELIRLKENNV